MRLRRLNDDPANDGCGNDPMCEIAMNKTLVNTVLLVALALLNVTNLNAILFTEYPNWVSEGRHDRIWQLREELQDIQTIVPNDEVVGYFSDIDREKNDAEFFRQMGLLQYAVAPIKISPVETSRIVIGNFLESSAPDHVKDKGLRLIKRINDSLVIYVREPH